MQLDRHLSSGRASSKPSPPTSSAIGQQQKINCESDDEMPVDAMDKKTAVNLELAGRRDGHGFQDVRSAAKVTNRLRKAKAWCITSSQRKTKKLEHRSGVKLRCGRVSKWGAQAYCDKEVKATK
ncbi:hypothetical protein LTR95_008115 [Oleoguttula sp. CCFEE 5521]